MLDLEIYVSSWLLLLVLYHLGIERMFSKRHFDLFCLYIGWSTQFLHLLFLFVFLCFWLLLFFFFFFPDYRFSQSFFVYTPIDLLIFFLSRVFSIGSSYYPCRFVMIGPLKLSSSALLLEKGIFCCPFELCPIFIYHVPFLFWFFFFEVSVFLLFILVFAFCKFFKSSMALWS